MTLLHAIASPPSPQHSRFNTTFASTATHNVIAATGLAITLCAAPTHPSVAGVPGPTPPGTTAVPPLTATRRAALVHTTHSSVSHVPALTKHTLPSVPSVLPLSPVRRVGRMTRYTSTRGLSPNPLTYFWRIVIPTLLPARELCVRYNHSQRKNYTKFFAKLFSHWLKTPLFRLQPLFYRERSQPPPFSCIPLAIKGRRKLPSTLRFLPLRESSPPHLPVLNRPFLHLLSDHEAKQPPLCATTPQSWTPNSTGINGYWKKERNPLRPANSPLLSLPPV